MYFSMKYIVEEDRLRIKVGWFANRFFPYSSIFGFQRVLAEAKNSYGLSTRKRIAIYMKGTGGGYDVVTITPKNDEGFIEAFAKQTGIDITPPDPTFREIQDEYNAKTSEAQRRAGKAPAEGSAFQRLRQGCSGSGNPGDLKGTGSLQRGGRGCCGRRGN